MHTFLEMPTRRWATTHPHTTFPAAPGKVLVVHIPQEVLVLGRPTGSITNTGDS